MVKTVSIGVQNLAAPCHCACRYCLLHSAKTAPDGVDYFRGKRIAERLAGWARETGFAPLPYYYVPYCADYPELTDTIAFNRSVGFAGARFLQCNGIAMRDAAQTEEFLRRIKDAGVTDLDTTFFGDEAFHDRFAARAGDWRFMLRLAETAGRLRLTVSPSVVLLRDNLTMLPALFGTLAQVTDPAHIHSFLPDYRGRGHLVENSRLTRTDCENLPENVKRTFRADRYKTEREWLQSPLPEYTKRALVITLRRDNIEMLERMTCAEMIQYVERLDDAYYAAVPGINELAAQYGNPENGRLYRPRDLFWMWQRRYIRENRLNLYDVTDERYCCTVRS